MPRDQNHHEKGSALVYILIAIALLAALTFTFMEPSSQQTSSQNTFKTVSGVESQVHLIRSSIQQCILTYPLGDSTIDNSGSGTDPYANKVYPINPDSVHYASATPGRSGDRLVRNIRCPGNNSGDADDHVKIFSGASGKFMPPAPDLFEDWQYYNGEDGVFFWIQTDKSDLHITAALNRIDNKFSECEADVVDATGSAEDLDSSGEVSCASGYTCFRVFMIANNTAVYNGDDENDEADCP
jgi:hypothetical protein